MKYSISDPRDPIDMNNAKGTTIIGYLHIWGLKLMKIGLLMKRPGQISLAKMFGVILIGFIYSCVEKYTIWPGGDQLGLIFGSAHRVNSPYAVLMAVNPTFFESKSILDKFLKRGWTVIRNVEPVNYYIENEQAICRTSSWIEPVEIRGIRHRHGHLVGKLEFPAMTLMNEMERTKMPRHLPLTPANPILFPPDANPALIPSEISGFLLCIERLENVQFIPNTVYSLLDFAPGPWERKVIVRLARVRRRSPFSMKLLLHLMLEIQRPKRGTKEARSNIIVPPVSYIPFTASMKSEILSHHKSMQNTSNHFGTCALPGRLAQLERNLQDLTCKLGRDTINGRIYLNCPGYEIITQASIETMIKIALPNESDQQISSAAGKTAFGSTFVGLVSALAAILPSKTATGVNLNPRNEQDEPNLGQVDLSILFTPSKAIEYIKSGRADCVFGGISAIITQLSTLVALLTGSVSAGAFLSASADPFAKPISVTAGQAEIIFIFPRIRSYGDTVTSTLPEGGLQSFTSAMFMGKAQEEEAAANCDTLFAIVANNGNTLPKHTYKGSGRNFWDWSRKQDSRVGLPMKYNTIDIPIAPTRVYKPPDNSNRVPGINSLPLDAIPPHKGNKHTGKIRLTPNSILPSTSSKNMDESSYSIDANFQLVGNNQYGDGRVPPWYRPSKVEGKLQGPGGIIDSRFPGIERIHNQHHPPTSKQNRQPGLHIKPPNKPNNGHKQIKQPKLTLSTDGDGDTSNESELSVAQLWKPR